MTATSFTVYFFMDFGLAVLTVGVIDEFSVVVVGVIGVVENGSVEVTDISVMAPVALACDCFTGEQTVTAFNWLKRLPTKICFVEIIGMILV